MVLAIWGASYSVDEKGHEYIQETRDPQQRANEINEMLREMLYLIDIHGILRKPSWDGVRLILLILPLTHGENLVPLRFNLTHFFSRNPNTRRDKGKQLLSIAALGPRLTLCLGDARGCAEPSTCALSSPVSSGPE